MVSQINFGNTFSSGGRTVVGGSNSGYDTEGLVKGLSDAKRLPAVKLEKKIELNGKKSEAFAELKTILDGFKDAANFLRNPPGVGNEGDNIFQYRSSTLSSSTSVAASNYLSTTIEPGTSLSNHTITVNSLATYSLQTTNTFALATTSTVAVGGAGPFNNGTWAIGPSGTPVTLVLGDTLEQAVNKINAVSETSGVEASILQVSTGNYRVQFKSTTTGAVTNYTLPVGMLNTGLAINQTATDSSLTIDGTTVTRATNSISDVVDGITFKLSQVTPPATSLSLDIQPDSTIVKNGILNFVDSYNALRLFTARQTEVGSSGKPKDTAILSSSASLRNIMSTVGSEVAKVVEGLTTSPNRLSELGITFNDFPGDEETPFTRNTLVVDEDILDSKLASNFDAVRKIFEFDFNSTDNEIQVFRRTNALNVSNFSLNADVVGGIYSATYNSGTGPVTVSLSGSVIPGGGFLLKGQSGTPFEGLELIYSGTVNTTATINLSQGIGDRLYNSLDDVLDEDTGSISIDIKSLEDSDTRAQEEIDRIDQIVERYRQQLLEKFSALESALGSINSILASLEANSNAQQNN